ncbi:MAG: heparinase II/III family protein [Hyphomonadaceae bacterium]
MRLSFMTSKLGGLAFAGAVAAMLVTAGCARDNVSADGASVSEAGRSVAGSSFEQTLDVLRAGVDARRAAGVPVPVPADSGGGYTHEQHKQNGKTIYEAAMLYEQTGDTGYRDFATEILLDYAELYPTLGLHPKVKPETPSRLFWQGLNEAWWLVYVIQGYDAIRDDIGEDQRSAIEAGLIRPMADFLSEGSPQTFNRIHNHGTWAAAAVGMTGYVLGERDYVDKALYGLDKSGDAGFLLQIESLFSPDGYYAEGPYYQRYALMPFVLFAQAIERNDPDLGIFDHRDGVLRKAIFSTVQQSYGGRFFPINDAIRQKGLNTAELRYAVAIAYDLTGDRTLLSIAQQQIGFVPTPEGRAVADAIDAGQTEPFPFRTLQLRDGPNGDRGALAILRGGSGVDDAALVMKAGSQGLGHGHFDWLGLIYYDNGDEIIADYGAARFLNVEPKNGGKYLPENLTWAKQTVAHNTLVVDQTTQFAGDWRAAELTAPTMLAFDDTPGASLAAAKIDTAYDGVALRRVVAMVEREGGGQYILDVMQAASDAGHSYDLPVHFKGQLIETSLPFVHETGVLVPLGHEAGYQHLWRTAQTPSIAAGTVSDLSLVIDDQFYTVTHTANRDLTAYLTRLGANDPDNNLRNEQAMILRAEGEDVSFFSVYERHGRYDNDEEVTVYSSGGSVQTLGTEKVGTTEIYSIATDAGGAIYLLIDDDDGPETGHTLTHKGETISWTGPFGLHVSEVSQQDDTTNDGGVQ